MSEKATTRFSGTYFNRDLVLRLERWSEVASWVILAAYGLDLLLAAGVFLLQYLRGQFQGWGLTDLLTNALYIVERPFRGVVYFILLQAVGKGLLILMDTEDNTRRAASND
jgi:hypothetical protein